jgi:hypothetical protein
MATSASVAELAAAVDADAQVPTGPGDRFAGYGVMGLPFASGHVLAMRRFPASSVGPGYTSVWHRDPGGRWAFWQDQPPEVGCARYFSTAIAEARRTPIELAWTGPDTLDVAVPDAGLVWSSTLRATPVTRVLSAVGTRLPDPLWRSRPVLAGMGVMAGAALRAGRVGLTGRAPNGQRFVANPLQVWLVATATASLGGTDLGPPGPLPDQSSLGDFRIPQRGVFAIGRSTFASA